LLEHKLVSQTGVQRRQEKKWIKGGDTEKKGGKKRKTRARGIYIVDKHQGKKENSRLPKRGTRGRLYKKKSVGTCLRKNKSDKEKNCGRGIREKGKKRHRRVFF